MRDLLPTHTPLGYSQGPIPGEYNPGMWRAVSRALLLASFLTPFLEAQRAETGFRGFAKVNRPSGHVRQGAFSNEQFGRNFHPHERPGALWPPYFLPYDESYWWKGQEPELVIPEPLQRVLDAPPNRERPPADAQLIEIPGAASQKAGTSPMPAVFVLISGERVETRRFVLTVSSLSINIDRCERVIPLEAVDVGATTIANRKRGINLRIPADRNEISLSF